MIRILLCVLVLVSSALAETSTTTSTSTSTTLMGMQRKLRAAEEEFVKQHGRQPKGEEMRDVLDEARKMPAGQVKKLEKQQGRGRDN